MSDKITMGMSPDLHQALQDVSSRLVSRGPNPMALEQRFVFDGAAAGDAVDMTAPALSQPDRATTLNDKDSAAPDEQVAAEFLSPGLNMAHGEIAGLFQMDPQSEPELLDQALSATEQIQRYLEQATDEQLFALFNGGQESADEQWQARLAELRDAIASERMQIGLQLLDNNSLQGALAAYSPLGSGGQPTIYLNSDWLQELGAQQISTLLIEEYGHHIDYLLNLDSDTPGDEGQRFAALVTGGDVSSLGFAADDDHTSLWLDGEEVLVERANFNFVNAYEVNTATTPAGKESNTHDFIFSGLGQVTVDDALNSPLFSGNDVSATSVVIDGTTYHGWISRPIKVQGEIKAFYFWTDADFTTLAAAQADGNTDGDRNVADNRGFILVVDQAYFNSLGWRDQTNNLKNIGSSSDRVDSSLNSLLKPNSGPTPGHDSVTIDEDSGPVLGNVLLNDTDPDLDRLTVTGFTINDLAGTLGANTSISGVGEFMLQADGNYSFTPAANYNGLVPVIVYSVSDGKGGSATASLSITVTPVNDAPTSTDDAISLRAGSTVFLGLGDFGTYQDVDGDPLAQIIISSLPSHGTLQFWDGDSWEAVSIDQSFTAAQINAGVLRITAGQEGSSIGFRVSDGSLNSPVYSLVITVPVPPATPTAIADSGTGSAYEAKEAGEGEGGSPASGNVLSNDEGDNIRVTAVFNSVVAANGDTQIKGQYGTLTIRADGSYSYAPDNSNATVDALNIGGSVTESFTYTVTDSNGNIASSTLTLKIEGSNDAPVGNDDLNSLKELFTAVGGNYGTVSGDVLSNDSDVDNDQSQLKVVIGDSDVIPGDGTSVSASATSPVDSAGTTYTVAAVGGSNWNSNNGIPTSYTNVLLDGQTIALQGGGVLQVLRTGTGQNVNLTFNSPETLLQYPLGTVFGAVGTTSTYQITAISAAVTSSTSITLTSTPAIPIEVGYSVSGTGIPGGTTVTAINGSQITLSTAVQITNRELTFSSADSSTPTAGTGEMLLAGQYGYLRIAEDGSYTYTLTSDALSAGSTYVETFNYQVTDPAGATDTAILRIRIDGTTNATAPLAANDNLSVSEDSSDSLNLLDNDSGATSVTGFTWGGQTGTLGEALNLPGIGTLTITSGGLLTFQPAANYNGSVPDVQYSVSWGTNTEISSATVSLLITPVNDAPEASNDLITTPKNTPAILTLGDFGNFSDVDGDALAVVKITSLPVAGTLEYFNGTVWVAALADQEISAADIQSGKLRFTPVTDAVGDNHAQIGFQVGDGSAFSPAYTLSVNVIDSLALVQANAPVNTLSAGFSLSDYQSFSIPGLSVDDADNDISSVTLTVANGTLAVTGMGATGAGTANNPLVITGSKAEIDALLATLVYTPASGFAGADTLRMHTVDDTGLSDTDFIAITVNADNRVLAVTGTAVNEASPYVLFKIDGASGQRMSLELASTGSGTGHASIGQDVLPALEYFNGTAWVTYAGGLVSIADGSSSLLVRAAVLQDSLNEGVETLKLIARNTAGTAAEGNSSISDQANGAIYLAANTSFAADTSGSGYPAYLDDDRAVSVNDVQVNEASPYAVFTVAGHAGQVVRLGLSDGSATVGVDTGSTLQYHNGAGWQDYTANSDITLAGSTLLVRISITQDDQYEGQESFSLQVTKQSSGTSVYGNGTIYDDGTGSIYLAGNTSGTPDTSGSGYPAQLDDDRSLTIDSPTVNEASNIVVFTLTGNSGQTASLELINESANGTVTGKANIPAQTLKVWDGLDWVNYDINNLPTFDGDGKLFVSVDISAEQDALYEGSETFKLKATLSGSSNTVTGTATIVDDGTGVKYTGITPTATDATELDDDRPVANTPAVIGGISSGSVTEDTATPNLSTGGTLTISDPDSGEAQFQTTGITASAGALGSLSINAAGVWTYSVSNSAVQYLGSGQSKVETFTVRSIDGTTHQVVVTILGVNDAPTASNLELSTGYGTVKAGNLPSATDVDGDSVSYVKASDPAHGSVVIQPNGQYSYTPSSGFSGQDSFSYSVSDGKGGVNTYTVTITVAANTPAVIGGVSSGSVTEDTATPNLSTGGTLTISDPDSGEAQFQTTGITASAGALGSLSINAAGVWTYSVSNSAVQYLGSGQSKVETFTVRSIDGTTHQVVVTILGVNEPALPAPPPPVADAPVPAPLAPAPVEEPQSPGFSVALPGIGLGSTSGLFGPSLSSFTSALAVDIGWRINPGFEPIPLWQAGFGSGSFADLTTSASGFRVLVIKAAEPTLTTYQGMADQYVESQGVHRFVTPLDTFAHTDANATVYLSAMLVDGRPLPEWLIFNPQTGQFEVRVPAGFKGELVVKIIARDNRGLEASALFRINVGEQVGQGTAGRTGLAEQLRAAANRPAAAGPARTAN
jgi:VCBS repeat-containing protein